jgi:hypothetical protein
MLLEVQQALVEEKCLQPDYLEPRRDVQARAFAFRKPLSKLFKVFVENFNSFEPLPSCLPDLVVQLVDPCTTASINTYPGLRICRFRVSLLMAIRS